MSLDNSDQQLLAISEMSSFEDFAEILKYSECVRKTFL